MVETVLMTVYDHSEGEYVNSVFPFSVFLTVDYGVGGDGVI